MEDLADTFIGSGQSTTKDAEQSNGLDKKKIRAGDYVVNADELTNKADDIAAGENTLNLSDNQAEEKQGIIIKPQGNENQQRQKRGAEQFAVNREEAIQPSGEEQYRKTLGGFITAEEGMFAKGDLVIEELQRKRQTTARQFFENEEITTAESATDDKEIQRLMQEQKEIRKRSRQRSKKQSL